MERFADSETGTGITLNSDAVRDSLLRSRCSLRQNDSNGSPPDFCALDTTLELEIRFVAYVRAHNAAGDGFVQRLVFFVADRPVELRARLHPVEHCQRAAIAG